jgi:predicted GNAT family acetyltransferase
MDLNPDDITFEETASRGRYSYRFGGEEAELTFSKAGEALVIIDHTGVPSAFRGKGIAEALVVRAVEDARAAGRKVLPLCSYAAAQFRRHPDWRDVLQGGRA